jgi:hypothetical protein
MKELLEKVLIYAIYHAKAKGDKNGEENGEKNKMV